MRREETKRWTGGSPGILLCVSLLAISVALAQEEEAEKTFSGTVELLYRSVDTNGSQNKFDEDFNGLQDGARLGQVTLDWRSVDSKVLDHARLDLLGLGGEPYESASFRMGRKDVYDLRISQRKQSYMYDLFSPAGAAVQLTDDLDGHSWNTDRRLVDIGLDFYLTDNFTLLFDMHENRRTGSSLFMKTIQGDLFRLNTPVDRTERRYTVGIRYDWERTSLQVGQTRRRYENNFNNSTMNDGGLDGADSTFLNNYLWQQTDDGTADYTTVQVNSALGSRVNLSFSYYGTLLGKDEIETSVLQDANGIDSGGNPIAIDSGFAQTELDGNTHLMDLDLAVQLARTVILHLGYRTYQRKMTGSGQTDLSAIGATTPISTFFDYNADVANALLELRPIKTLTLRVGGQLVSRDLTREGFDPLDPTNVRNQDFKSDGDLTLLFGFVWRAADWVRLSGDYEVGDVERPFTVTSPYQTERLRARVAFMPADDMRIDLSYLDFKNTQNALAYDHIAEGDTWSAAFWHKPNRYLEYSLGYSEQGLDATTQILFDGPGFGANEDGTTQFDDTNRFIHAQFMVHFSDRWDGFLRYIDSEADGTNPFRGEVSGLISLSPLNQEYQEWELGLTRRFPSGLFVGGSVREIDYKDVNTALDYDGTILTVRAGIRF